MCFSCYLYREVDRNKIDLDFFVQNNLSVPAVITSVTLLINFSSLKSKVHLRGQNPKTVKEITSFTHMGYIYNAVSVKRCFIEKMILPNMREHPLVRNNTNAVTVKKILVREDIW